MKRRILSSETFFIVNFVRGGRARNGGHGLYFRLNADSTGEGDTVGLGDFRNKFTLDATKRIVELVLYDRKRSATLFELIQRRFHYLFLSHRQVCPPLQVQVPLF